MRLFLAAAFAALPFATSANAANVYAACSYQNEAGKIAVTQIFTLKGDALKDDYNAFTYEKALEWEQQFAAAEYPVLGISGYYPNSLVGQFAKYAEEHGDSHSNCWMTTTKDRAAIWYGKMAAGGRLDTTSMEDWRPDSKAGVLAVEDWSGRPSAGALQAQAESQTDARNSPKIEEAAPETGPRRHKMTSAEADAKFAADKAEYEKKLAEQKKQVDGFKRARDDVARRKQEQKLAAERATADYQRQLEAHAQTVRNQQLEYQKQIAKPAGAPNAVYRGFWAQDCEAARKSATLGAGTSTTTRFKEVTSELGDSGCVVQGWWWNVTGGGTATRQ